MPHIYALADLHGRYDLFQQVKDFLQPDDTVIVLGDCGDRGPDGWKIIKEVYENPQFIYLKGNHEDFFVNAINEEEFWIWYANGGEPTYDGWLEDGADMSWVKKLDELPYEYHYRNQNDENVILCHAGYTPHKDMSGITNEIRLWSREHFNQMWDEDFLDTVMVHGHTPNPYMHEFLYESYLKRKSAFSAFWYSPDSKGHFHKVNIDCGAVFTGFTLLLDLDTWVEHIFKEGDCTND